VNFVLSNENFASRLNWSLENFIKHNFTERDCDSHNDSKLLERLQNLIRPITNPLQALSQKKKN